MRVRTLKIHDFRGIRDLELDFADKKSIILVGENGAGKSSILDCLAILLSRFIWRIRRSKGTGRFFTEYDLNNQSNETYNSISITYQDHNIDWLVAKRRKGRKGQTMTNQEQIHHIAEQIWTSLDEAKDFNLPLAVYYPVNRAVLDIPLRIRKKHAFDQLAAYDLALSGGRNDFRIFFEWFRNREDLENEIRLKKHTYRDRQLEAVRSAISSILDGFSDLHVRRSPNRMVITKHDVELVVNQLSDGEKCLLAMAGDLARRLAIANPGLEKPLNGEGVVLIDEIDLHLHPKWQRDIVPALEKTFPHCQFIGTTHSPQVLSNVKPESIILLEDSVFGIKAHQPLISFGRDANQLLEIIFNVPERPKSIKDRLNKLFRLIDEGKLEDATTLRRKLEKEIGEDEPEFTKADILMRRMKAINK